MSFFGKNPDARLRRNAENLLLAAEKVLRYRGDIFDESERERFDAAVAAVREALAQKPTDAEKLSVAAGTLDAVLRELGGTIFPKRTLPEWVELLVVAAILAGGIRAFFVQPFKIPTNSMFPTYNGMTAELAEDSQGFFGKWAERIFRSASFYEIVSPADGEVFIPLRFDAGTRAYSLLPPMRENGSGDIVSPGKEVYRLIVGNTVVPVEVPRDFSLNEVLLKTFFPEADKTGGIEAARWREVFRTGKISMLPDGSPVLRTGKFVRRGEKLLAFKIFGGDMVLVERISGHFREPRRGEPFVFRTHNIPGLNNVELYYVKRLAGKPGDILRVADGKLLVNGVPADFAEAMCLNNAPAPEKKYYGYLPTCGTSTPYGWELTKDFRVPAGYYFALGDNSANSYDSRGWGGVPAKDVVGSALFILYPFSPRWGLAE